MDTEDRRKVENSALRNLVDALQSVTKARDAIWSISILDKIFRRAKCKKAFAAYYAATQNVRDAIKKVMATSKKTVDAESATRIDISLEEIEYLIGNPGNAPKNTALKP